MCMHLCATTAAEMKTTSLHFCSSLTFCLDFFFFVCLFVVVGSGESCSCCSFQDAACRADSITFCSFFSVSTYGSLSIRLYMSWRGWGKGRCLSASPSPSHVGTPIRLGRVGRSYLHLYTSCMVLSLSLSLYGGTYFMITVMEMLLALEFLFFLSP